MPKLVDIYVGNRLRSRRKQLKVSQEKLAEALDRTFQQVQKYERGYNRISASTLYEAAKFLEAPVGFFFEGFDTLPTDLGDERVFGEAQYAEFWSSDDGAMLARKFPKIHDARLRNQILGLVDALVADE